MDLAEKLAAGLGPVCKQRLCWEGLDLQAQTQGRAHSSSTKGPLAGASLEVAPPTDIHVALRKLVLLLKPDKEIDDRGTHMTVKTLSPFRNYVMEFEVGVEFEEDLRIVDGRKCQTIVTWEEEQLVCVQRGEVPNRGWRHWLEGEKLYLELTAGDAVCEQVFRKVR